MNEQEAGAAEHATSRPGRRIRWALVAVVGAVVIAGIGWWFNRPLPPLPDQAVKQVMPPHDPIIDTSLFPSVILKDVSAELGVDFVHENGAVGSLFMPEPLGSGGGFFDYDNDGDPDLLLLSCCPIADHLDPPADGRSIVLYENDGRGHFTDVTAGSGLEISCYAMGLAMA
ncbi:MAG: VCBS repeat-containing protein, partial [Pirellulaceae bacterium]|nr:VCBS repeat-containing protein [Pirellulaceae bacterium]